MFIHKENALKAHFKQKKTTNTKSNQNIHQDASNCRLYKNFLAG